MIIRDFMIGKVIKTMRKDNNLKQSDLIKQLNIGQSTLSDYENEKISIDFETIEKIAKYAITLYILKTIKMVKFFKLLI